MARTVADVLRLVAYRAERAMAVADEMRAFAILPEGLPKIDTGLANVARAWNYMVGGKDNFEADREAARQLMGVAPVIRIAAPASRAFLARAGGSVRRDAGEPGCPERPHPIPESHSVMREVKENSRGPAMCRSGMGVSTAAAVDEWMICASGGGPPWSGRVGRLGAVRAARAALGVGGQAGQEVLPSLCY
jgi:hypothetical protein